MDEHKPKPAEPIDPTNPADPEEQPRMSPDALSLLYKSARQIKFMRYAIGFTGVVSAIAIAVGLFESPELAAIAVTVGIPVVFSTMIAIMAAQKLFFEPDAKESLFGRFFTRCFLWAYLTCFIVGPLFLLTVGLFSYPIKFDIFNPEKNWETTQASGTISLLLTRELGENQNTDWEYTFTSIPHDPQSRVRTVDIESAYTTQVQFDQSTDFYGEPEVFIEFVSIKAPDSIEISYAVSNVTSNGFTLRIIDKYGSRRLQAQNQLIIRWTAVDD